MLILLEIAVNGLSVGGIYALIALGFVLIYKSTGVINFSQGELSMLGAYIFYGLSVIYHFPFGIAFILTLIICALVGIIIEYLILRHMVGEPLFSVIMVTVGLASIITSLVGVIFGHDVHALSSPFSGQVFTIGHIAIAKVNLFIVGSSLILFILFFLYFKMSPMGIGMRATSEDQDAAQLMGINIRKVFGIAWAISAAVAAVGGIFLAEQTLLHTGMGHIGLRVFAAAILGGMDSPGGAILGGFLIGLLENIAGVYLGGEVKEVVAFSVILLVLIIRPYGLFGTREIEKV